MAQLSTVISIHLWGFAYSLSLLKLMNKLSVTFSMRWPKTIMEKYNRLLKIDWVLDTMWYHLTTSSSVSPKLSAVRRIVDESLSQAGARRPTTRTESVSNHVWPGTRLKPRLSKWLGGFVIMWHTQASTRVKCLACAEVVYGSICQFSFFFSCQSCAPIYKSIGRINNENHNITCIWCNNKF